MGEAIINAAIDNHELVARIIFPPQMILMGKVMPAAFVLRPSINEEYLSILRISVPTFNQDIKKIIYGRKRSFYGYAVMNAGEIHAINLTEEGHCAKCLVKTVDADIFQSHGGIFIILDDKQVTGSMSFESLEEGKLQNHLLLALRFKLKEIANKGLISF